MGICWSKGQTEELIDESNCGGNDSNLSRRKSSVKPPGIEFRVKISNIRLVLRPFVKATKVACEVDFDGNVFNTSTGEVVAGASVENENLNQVEWPNLSSWRFVLPIDRLRDLEDKYLLIRCLQNNKKKSKILGYVLLELDELATGPVRCERAIYDTPRITASDTIPSIVRKNNFISTKRFKSAIGRVSLECRMEPVRKWSLYIKNLHATLETSTAVRRWISPALRNQHKFELSYTYSRHLPRTALADIDEDSELSQYAHRKTYEIKESRQEGNLSWDEEKLIPIEDSSSFDELVHSSVRIQIYRVYASDPSKLNIGNKNEEPIDDNIVWHRRLYGECWVPCTKLIAASNDSPDEAHLVSSLNSKLWLKGKLMGVVQASIKFENLPETTQMLSGVNTEQGVMCVGPLVESVEEQVESRFPLLKYLGFRNDRVPIPSALRHLIKLFGNLQRILAAPHSEKEVMILAEKILVYSRTASKSNMLSFVYENQDSLRIGRTFFINLCMLLLEFLDVVRHETRCCFFDIIFTALKRAELSDPRQFCLGGENDMVRTSRSSRLSRQQSRGTTLEMGDLPPAPSDRDVELAMRYRNLLYGCFAYAIRRLNVKESFEELRLFSTRMLVIAYFRLPMITAKMNAAILPAVETNNAHWQEVINTLTPKGQRFNIPEWRENRYNINTPDLEELRTESCVSSVDFDTKATTEPVVSSRKEQIDPVLEILNWSTFHNALALYVDASDLRAHENQVPKQDSWITRLSKHGYFFFLFAEEYIRYIFDALTLWEQDTIRWELLPGYIIILKAFLLEMKRFPVDQYSESMVSLSISLLANESLISVFMRVVLLRTNCADLAQVARAFELLGIWLDSLSGWDKELALWNFPLTRLNMKRLPDSFDSEFLCFSINVLLQSANNQVLLHTIMFLYHTWNNFPEECVIELKKCILMNHFFRLFSHWSWITRNFFHHLLLYRIINDHSNSEDQIQFQMAIKLLEAYVAGEFHVMEENTKRCSLYAVRPISPVKRPMLRALSIDTGPSSPRELHSGLFDITADVNTERNEEIDRILRELKPEFDVPSYQLIYIKDSLMKYKQLVKDKTQEIPDLQWHTVILEDTHAEQLENPLD